MIVGRRRHAVQTCWHNPGMNVRRLAIALIVSMAAVACSSSTPTTKPTSEITIAGVEAFSGLSRNHVDTPVSYPQSPPVGGDHAPQWQNCGVYDAPVKNENAVHSLEHGAVWLAYRPDLAADQVDKIRALARQHTHVLVSPYEGLKEAVVATAWGKQLRLDSVTDARLAAFVTTFEEGPQTPELGATCSGAIGQPIE